MTNAVLYKIWKKNADIQEEMNEIIAEVQKGEWFVSMEALFTNFDYGLMGSEAHKIIARNSETSFLNKYLSAYGGPGEYENQKLGRVLRNITFSAVGLVRKPANPKSIIITDKFKSTKADFGGKMNEDLKKENDELKVKLEKAQADLAAKNSEKLDTEIKDLKAKLAQADADKVAAEKIATESSAIVTEAGEKTKKAVEELNAVKAELDKIALEQKRKDRVALAVAKGKTEEEAVEFEKKFANLDDTTFASVISLIEVKTVEIPKEPVKETSAAEIPSKELETPVQEAELNSTDVEVADASVINELKSFLKGDK